MLTDKQEIFCREYNSRLNVLDAEILSKFKFKYFPGERYFVYFLIDPRTDKIFYIGKGKNQRPYDHIRQAYHKSHINPKKTSLIRDILESGNEVLIRYFKTNLSESDAFTIERLSIKEIGRDNLTNHISGTFSIKEHCLLKLRSILPYDIWKSRHPDLEREYGHYYDKIVKEYQFLIANSD